jgi:opacity protein-like surface antigen
MIRLKSILGILLVLMMCSVPAARAQQPPQDPPAQQGQQAQSGQQAQPADDYPEEEEDATSEGPAVTFGLKAGLNFVNLRSDDPAKQKMVPVGGVFVGVQGDGRIGFGIEVLYTMKGYKTDARTVDLDYLQLPVLVSYSLPNVGKIRPYISTGPAGSLRIRSAWGSAKESTQSTFESKLQRFELSWVASAGVDVPMLGGGARLEARYEYGLTPVFTGTSDYGNKSDKFKTLTVFLGYRF